MAPPNDLLQCFPGSLQRWLNVRIWQITSISLQVCLFRRKFVNILADLFIILPPLQMVLSFFWLLFIVTPFGYPRILWHLHCNLALVALHLAFMCSIKVIVIIASQCRARLLGSMCTISGDSLDLALMFISTSGAMVPRIGSVKNFCGNRNS